MKKLITLILTLGGMACATPKSAACDYREVVVACAAPYRVGTCEIGRCSYGKMAYDHCGNAFHYIVTVVTYRDFYSDGSSRTYQRSFRD